MHSGDSLTYNPAPWPELPRAAFSDFVFCQDEAPARQGNLQGNVSVLPDPVIQKRFSDTSFVRTSLFGNHSLKPTSEGSLSRPQGDFFWLSAVLLGVLFLLTLLRLSGYRRVTQAVRAFAVVRHTGPLSREGAIYREQQGFYLFMIYVSVTALFLFSLQSQLAGAVLPVGGFRLYLLLCLAVTAYYFVQLFVIRILGFVFNTGRETSEYVLNHFLFSVIPSLFLFVPVSLTVFSPEEISKTMLYLCATAYGIVYIYRFIRGAIAGLGPSKFPVYYLFLYLCTVEILPLLVVFKFIYSRFL